MSLISDIFYNSNDEFIPNHDELILNSNQSLSHSDIGSSNIKELKQEILQIDQLIKNIYVQESKINELQNENLHYKAENLELKEKLQKGTHAITDNRVVERINFYRSRNEQLNKKIEKLEKELKMKNETGSDGEKKELKIYKKLLQEKEEEIKRDKNLIEELYNMIDKQKSKIKLSQKMTGFDQNKDLLDENKKFRQNAKKCTDVITPDFQTSSSLTMIANEKKELKSEFIVNEPQDDKESIFLEYELSYMTKMNNNQKNEIKTELPICTNENKLFEEVNKNSSEKNKHENKKNKKNNELREDQKNKKEKKEKKIKKQKKVKTNCKFSFNFEIDNEHSITDKIQKKAKI